MPQTWIFFFAYMLCSLSASALVCPDIFKNSQNNFTLSYERRCINSNWKNSYREQSFRGEVKILSRSGDRLGSYRLACPSWKDGVNLILQGNRHEISARTMVLSNGEHKQIYLMDCNGNALFFINIGEDQIEYQNNITDTFLTVFQPLGALPAAYLAKSDYDDGQIIIRNINGDANFLVKQSQANDGNCDYPQWHVENLGASDDADPKLISLIVSYLELSQDPFDSCVELAWKPFALTMVIPTFLAAAIGIYKLARWKRNALMKLGYIAINSDNSV
jgi:hypothetical protein